MIRAMFTRREFFATSTAALAATTLGRFSLLAQQPPAPVNPVFKELRRNVGLFTARGGTIGWLVNPSGVIAVDSQFPDTAQACLDGLLERSKGTQIAALINTHHHGDHTAGNGTFRPKTKQIIAHANVPKYMKATYDQQVANRAKQSPPASGTAPQTPVVPDRTLTDALQLEHGDERISIKHHGPAHTGGDVVIYFEQANVAHMGDLIFNRMQPFIDRANGASIQNWTKVLNTVASELPADTMYIFGHAGPKFEVTGTRADLQHFAKFLSGLLEYARAQVKAGKTREQVIASTDVVPGFDDFGPLVQRSITAAYDEVSAK